MIGSIISIYGKTTRNKRGNRVASSNGMKTKSISDKINIKEFKINEIKVMHKIIKGIYLKLVK